MMVRLCSLLGLFCITTFLTSFCQAQSPDLVQRITAIDFQILLSDPPQLVVTANGFVPSAGYSDTRLLQAQYVQPPQDGIQDYFLVSTPPAGPAAPVITEVSAQDRIERYTVDMPWLKGVRVHGIGTGVMTKMLSGGLRIRKNILDLMPAELAAFKQGVQNMKNRPLSDNRSWSFQANMHGEETPANDVLWNQCQHGTLQFFTWHRAYLLEFERILRDASGDPNFNLPYWDWSTARSLPAAFRDPTSPLFEPNRTINGGQLLPTSVVVDDLNNEISNVGFNDFSFGLEGSPHGQVHVLIGGRMGRVPTAANDPIFWLHHCNLDRVWDSWLALGGGRTNPNDPTFLNRTFTLVGASGATVTHRAGDLLSSASLGYRYSNLSGSMMSPSPTIESQVTGMMVAMMSAQGEKEQAITVASSKPESPTVPSPTLAAPQVKPLGLAVERVELESRADAQQRMRAAVESASSVSEEKIYVDIVGLNAKDTPRFVYTVYLNLPTGPVTEELKKLYRVSTINFFGVGGEPAKAGDHSHGTSGVERVTRQRFDATRTIAKLREAGLWKEGKYTITLEPLTPVSTKAEDADLNKLLTESAEKCKITYERIDISIIAK